jgi:cell division protein FtsW
VSLIVFEPYRMRRVSSFLDPFADQQNSGYQLSNALMAFGRGEWTGVGLGNGVQKLHYLPEAHNDFLLAVIGEELGMLGTVTVILLFTLIAYRALRIGALAEKAGDRFAVYIAYGAGLWLAIQAFFNIAVNLGVMPTKGLTLPLMSFGGNSILVSCAVIGMLLRIYSEVAPRAETTKGGLAWRTSS